MQHILRILFIGALAMPIFLSTNAMAEESANCQMAQMGAAAGKEYEPVFERAKAFLNDNDIPYMIYGRKKFVAGNYGLSEQYCSDVYGGCGADLFDIAVSLEASGRGLPSVFLTEKPGATDGNLGYVLLGKLSGLIDHEACASDMYLNGHGWMATRSPKRVTTADGAVLIDDIVQVGQKKALSTTLSRVGYTIASGYEPSLSSFSSGYDDQTILIKIDDFKTSAKLQNFIQLIEPINMEQ